MKKLGVVLTLAAVLLWCAGCGKPQPMEISQAQLSEQEQQLLTLAGYEMNGQLYDYQMDESLASLQVTLYQLNEDASGWVKFGGGTYVLSDEAGRLAVSFENLRDGAHVAILSGDDIFTVTHHSAESKDPEKNPASVGAMWITNAPLEYDVEVPLVVQCFSRNPDGHSVYFPDSYFTPEIWKNSGCDEVYLITLRFSRESVF